MANVTTAKQLPVWLSDFLMLSYWSFADLILVTSHL